MSSLFESTYNPDVLSCIANLSNDEVFTPPEVPNQMLDLIPEEIWSDPTATFLDPACKSGVFLREIAKRLISGLENEFPILEERLEHIFKKQLYGMAITELTSLLSRRSVYCSKYPTSVYSVVQFDNPEGNIDYKQMEHKWYAGRCEICGASQKEYERDESLEQYAYEFIHIDNPEEVFNMKFDVIVSNPPYQLSDAGNGKSAKPIYQHFIQQAKKLNPRYMTMIIPSRWFSGGKGLDVFRQEMLTDNRLRKLVDYENFKDVFPGVDLAGGACYFLWERDYRGECEVVNYASGKNITAKRSLNEFEYFIRDNRASSIVKKVQAANASGATLSNVISSRKPFGLPTNYQPKDAGIPCHFVQRIGVKWADPADVDDPNCYLDKWKVLIPPAPIAGQTDFSKPVGFYYWGNTRIGKPGECCTESFLVAAAFETEEEANNFRSYLFTKTARFLLLQAVVSQHVTKKNFCFVPDLGDYSFEISDEYLRNLWGITDEEWDIIDSKISKVELTGFSSKKEEIDG